jgi:hypothetical protein
MDSAAIFEPHGGTDVRYLFAFGNAAKEEDGEAGWDDGDG